MTIRLSISKAGNMTKDDTMEALGGFYESLAAAAEAGDSAGYARHFIPNGVLLLPKRAPIVGKDAIRDWSEMFQQRLALTVNQYEQVQIDRLGEVALVRSWGTGSYLIRATGERVPFEHNYLDVFVYAETRWLMACHQGGSANLLPNIWDREWEKG
jgi:uncharacterized protein (TIGR02246 family)